MKLHEMKLLIRVAQTGSMTLAARQLHLTPSAVSATIQRIEESLGIRLFERTTRSIHPTDEGLVLLDACREVVDRWQRALEDVQGDRTTLEGTVHISAPADTMYTILESVFAEFSTQHPKLRLILNTSDATQHIQRNAIDMAIHYDPPQNSTLTTRKLAFVPNILVASPAYLERHGEPTALGELTQHRCLTHQLSGQPNTAWVLRDTHGTHEVPLAQPLCGDGFLAHTWAVSGHGVAFKSIFDVIDDLESGRLVRVLPEYIGPPCAVHAVFPSRRFQTARVRALYDVVAAHCSARQERCDAWLGGASLK